MALLGSGEHYALEVAGDSMIDAGILDGDTVIIRRGETAENGQIVVALVDDNEVTLKRLRRRGNSIALEPANKAVRDPHLPGRPGEGAGTAGGATPALLRGWRRATHRTACETTGRPKGACPGNSANFVFRFHASPEVMLYCLSNFLRSRRL